MHYSITVLLWSQLIRPDFSHFSQQGGRPEGYEVDVFKSSAYEDESDEPHQSDLLTPNVELKD